jgi:hypothetical protein
LTGGSFNLPNTLGGGQFGELLAVSSASSGGGVSNNSQSDFEDRLLYETLEGLKNLSLLT